VATLPPENLSSSMLAHWTFDDGSMSTAHDSSGNGRDGQIFGSNWSWLTDGRFAGALHFGGPDSPAGGDSVVVSGFPQATAAFTVSAWYRVSAAAADQALSQVAAMLSNELMGGGWALNLAPTTPGTGMGSPNFHFAYFVGPTINDFERVQCDCVAIDTWTHIVTVFDRFAGTMVMYVNAVQVDQIAVSEAIPRGSSTLDLGRWPSPGRFLTGDLDDVALWSRALVGEEIEQLYRAPAPNVP
jgi:hypothetical protein